jgi:membrane protease YdiL (CAAX protease family)
VNLFGIGEAGLVAGVVAAPVTYTPLDYILLVIVVAIIPLLSFRTGRAMARVRPTSLVPRYWSTIVKALFLAALVIAAWLWAGRPFAQLGFDWPIGFRGQLGFAYAAVIAAYYTYATLIRRVPEERVELVRTRLEKLRIVPDTPEEFRLFPLVALVGSTMEELLYRGYLIWLLAPFASLWGAAVISSVLFGLGHVYQCALGIVRTGLIGFAFAIGYVLTGSLWWLIVVHILVNLFGGALAWRMQRLAPTTS